MVCASTLIIAAQKVQLLFSYEFFVQQQRAKWKKKKFGK